MDSKDVSREQAETISRWLVPAMARLAKQHERMKAVGFVLDDSLMQKVIAATEATRQLRLALHDIEERERPSKAPDVPAGIKARDGQPEPPAAE